MALIIKYDSEANVFTVKVKEGALTDEKLLDNDVIVGCDKSGKLVSLEILDASKKGLLNAFMDLAKSKKETAKLLLSKISWKLHEIKTWNIEKKETIKRSLDKWINRRKTFWTI